MQSISTQVDADTHAALKRVSKDNGIKIRFIVKQAIEEWIAKHTPKAKRAA